MIGQGFIRLIQSRLQCAKKLLGILWLNSLIHGVVTHFLTPQGREEGSAAQHRSKITGEGSYIGAFSAMDAEVGLGQVRGYLA